MFLYSLSPSHSYFYHSEFEEQSWSKPKNGVYGKNLHSFMRRVNALSHWAASAIVLPEVLYHFLRAMFCKTAILSCRSCLIGKKCSRNC